MLHSQKIIIIGKNSHNIELRSCAKLLIFNISLVPLDEFTLTEHFFKQLSDFHFHFLTGQQQSGTISGYPAVHDGFSL